MSTRAQCFLAGTPVTGGTAPTYCWGRLERAHWIKQQVIRREYRTRILAAVGGEVRALLRAELAERLADPRGWAPMCHGHHKNADHGNLRIMRAQVPATAEAWADELGLTHELDRHYGC